MTLALPMVIQLAAACAPAVAPETIAAIARTESGFDPLAIGDNTTARTYAPASKSEAIGLAVELTAEGHSLDLGFMQVNSANLQSLHLSIADAFDPCRSIEAGARILTAAFAGGVTPAAMQAALRVALSRYNTGDAQRGFLNGYVGRVEASARVLVPALQVTGRPDTAPSGTEQAAPSPSPAPAEADGEWHAGPSLGAAPEGGESEWHAAEVTAQPPAAITPSAIPGPASVVVLQGQPGRK
jgi:type IV secretion system protein VirB1